MGSRSISTERQACVDRLLAVAAEAYGTFSLDDARLCGLSRQAIGDLVQREVAVRLQRGIYAFTEWSTMQVDYVGAWRRAGSDAVYSHCTALSLWDLSDVEPRGFEFVVPRAKRARARTAQFDLLIHTTTRPPTIRWIDGVPVTTPARSVVDVASVSPVSGEQIEMAVAQMLGRALATEEELRAELRGRPAFVAMRIERAIARRASYAGYV